MRPVRHTGRTGCGRARLGTPGRIRTCDLAIGSRYRIQSQQAMVARCCLKPAQDGSAIANRTRQLSDCRSLRTSETSGSALLRTSRWSYPNERNGHVRLPWLQLVCSPPLDSRSAGLACHIHHDGAVYRLQEQVGFVDEQCRAVLLNGTNTAAVVTFAVERALCARLATTASSSDFPHRLVGDTIPKRGVTLCKQNT